MKYTDTGKKDTRSGFGAGLYEAGKQDSRVVALTADLKGSLKMDKFADEFPERFVQCGIAEANMIGVAAGLAITGKIPFAGSFAEFVTGRVYDQIRQEVCYGETNVKIAASHAGITLGEDGATHQTMEDIALMRALPGMVVINPCDYNQTKAATIAAARYNGPVYLRFGRPSVPNFTPEDQEFEIGKAYKLRNAKDMNKKVAVFSTGAILEETSKACDMLEENGIAVEQYSFPTVKPIDRKVIEDCANRFDNIFTVEEHNIVGGFGGAVAEVLAECGGKAKLHRIGIDDFYCIEVGSQAYLREQVGINAEGIVRKVKGVFGE